MWKYDDEEISMKHEEIIEKHIQDTLAPSESLKWISSIIGEFKKEVEDNMKAIKDIIYINTKSIGDFKKEVEAYAKEYPDAKISAAGFMMVTEDGKIKKKEKYKYKSGK